MFEYNIIMQENVWLDYHIARKFGGELNLAVWRIDHANRQIKVHQY